MNEQNKRSAAEGVEAMLEKQRRDTERRKQQLKEQKAQRERNQRLREAGGMTDEQNMLLFHGMLYAILIALWVKVFASAISGLSIIVIPPVLLYASQTLPSDESFDAKRELKRVLRGAHLPEDDPHKPKTWLGKTMAKVQASVVTEASTALGYEVCLTKIMGFCTVACVTVPSAKKDFYWIGAFKKWWYVMQRDIPDAVNNNKMD